MRCALVSATLDLNAWFGEALARVADRVEPVTNPEPDLAREIRLALAWNPPADAFARYPGLEAVCSIGAGVDSLLACPSLRPDIDVVRVVDPAQAQMMAGYVIWQVIGHQRGFAAYQAQQRAALWRKQRQRPPGDVPVAILGCGAIGSRVATDLAALGFPVLAWSRGEKALAPGLRGFHGPDGLRAMLAETEVLVNLLPLTRETHGILDRSLFAAMRRGGYLVQVGRGPHLVEDDLLWALESGQLAGASLDVFAAEPLAAAHPFWRHPRILITPHDACDASPDAIAATLAATADALRAGHRPAHRVDRDAGY